MRKLRRFLKESDYLNIKDTFTFPNVSLTKDTKKSWVKPSPNYIIATYKWDVTEQSVDTFNTHYINDFYVNGRPDFVKTEELISINDEGNATYKIILQDWVENTELQINDSIFYYMMDYNYGYYCVPLINIDFSHARIKLIDYEPIDDYRVWSPLNYILAPELLSINGLKSIDVSKLTNLSYAFAYCCEVKTLDLSSFDTSNVTNMRNMFFHCYDLESINFGENWNTENVYDMSLMFYYCDNLISLDLTSFDTSNVDSMDLYNMFSYCISLKSITISEKFITNDTMFMNRNYSNNTASYSNCILNYICNNTGNTMMYNQIDSYYTSPTPNPLGCNITYLVKILDYNNNTYSTNLNLTLSNGVSGVYNSEMNGYTFTFKNVKDIVEYDVMSNDTKIGTLKTYLEQQLIVINCNNTIINEVIKSLDDSYSYDLINNSYGNNIIKKYVDCIESVEREVSCSFDDFNYHQVILIFDSTNITNMNSMFSNCEYIINLEIKNIDTSNVTTMGDMFYNCRSLTSLDLSSFDTSNVTDMSYMFNGCNSLTSLNISSFDTSNVTNMRNMFRSCEQLSLLDVSSFNTSGVTNMNSMFGDCFNLTSLDLSSFDTSNVTNMNYMFGCCRKLSLLDVSSFNTSKVTNMNGLFYQSTYRIETLDLSNFDFANYTYIEDMFTTYDYSYNFSTKLKTIICNCEYAYLFKELNNSLNIICNGEINIKVKLYDNGELITNGNVKFKEQQLTYNETEKYWECSLNNNDIDTSLYYNNNKIGDINFTNEINYIAISSKDDSQFDIIIESYVNEYMTIIDNSYYDYITDLYINGINALEETSYIPDGYMCKIQMSINISELTSIANLFSYCSLYKINFNNSFKTSNITDMSYMFNGCNGLTSLDLSSFDTSKVTNMSGMFNYCSGLTSLDLSHFNTSGVTNMSEMFYECNGLTSLDLSSFDTSNVTDMSDMFGDCYNLTSLDLSGFNTSGVTNMSYMFYGCNGLTSLDLSSFDTSKVTNMSNMFNNCRSLTLLDLSNFNTSGVTTMSDMFNRCNSLTSLDLSSFDTNNVTNMSYMFYYCNNLNYIKLLGNISNLTSYGYMFDGITTNGTFTINCEHEDAWKNILITNQSKSDFPSSWKIEGCIDTNPT